METATTARQIAEKWVRRFGYGFHPDTRGKDYDPPLTEREAQEYDSDMARLFAFGGDPYEIAIRAMQKLERV